MIGTTNKSVLSRFGKVTGKSIIAMISSLSSLHKNKFNGKISQTALRQLPPVDISLIMRYIDTMHIITARYTNSICFQPITRFPTISIRPNKEIIKCHREKSDNDGNEHITQPYRHSSTNGLFHCLSRRTTGSSRFFFTRYRLTGVSHIRS